MTNAERLQHAAQQALDHIKRNNLTGNMRDHYAVREVYNLIGHARFLGETLPGVAFGKEPGAASWEGTAYRALQRIANQRLKQPLPCLP